MPRTLVVFSRRDGPQDGDHASHEVGRTGENEGDGSVEAEGPVIEIRVSPLKVKDVRMSIYVCVCVCVFGMSLDSLDNSREEILEAVGSQMHVLHKRKDPDTVVRGSLLESRKGAGMAFTLDGVLLHPIVG